MWNNYIQSLEKNIKSTLNNLDAFQKQYQSFDNFIAVCKTDINLCIEKAEGYKTALDKSSETTQYREEFFKYVDKFVLYFESWNKILSIYRSHIRQQTYEKEPQTGFPEEFDIIVNDYKNIRETIEQKLTTVRNILNSASSLSSFKNTPENALKERMSGLCAILNNVKNNISEVVIEELPDLPALLKQLNQLSESLKNIKENPQLLEKVQTELKQEPVNVDLPPILPLKVADPKIRSKSSPPTPTSPTTSPDTLSRKKSRSVLLKLADKFTLWKSEGKQPLPQPPASSSPAEKLSKQALPSPKLFQEELKQKIEAKKTEKQQGTAISSSKPNIK